jgi:hypothetical protein
MAKEKEEVRIYSMSDGDMIQTVDDVIGSATRDTTELTPEGVDSARLTALEGKRDDFDEMEDDEEWEGFGKRKSRGQG